MNAFATIGSSTRATQAQRMMSLAVESLPADALLLVELEGQEAISGLYSFTLHCVSETPQQIKLDKILERGATVRVRLHDGSARYISGIVSRCSCDGRDMGGDKRFTKYTLELVPWLWLLTRTTDCRIFQDKTAPEIIEAVFHDLGIQDFKNSLTTSYVRRDYCVQYRETDFNFVSRLMEEEGIFYYFEHTSSGHKLVLADTPQVCKLCPKQESARYEPDNGIGDREDRVLTWSEQRELRSGKITYRDNNFQMPLKPLQFNVPTKIKSGADPKLEVYDYPGDYAHPFNKPEQRLDKVEPLGEHFAKLRMEAEEAQHLVASGASLCRAFFTGAKFRFQAPSGLTSGEFLITSLQHSARCQSGYVTGGGPEDVYSNQFTCIPANAPFRPQRLAEKPIVHGSQTAVVVGPKGEQIYPDKFGRVKVQFHWDRQGKHDEHSSCWVRCSQTHAAPSFGCISLPRIGEEVIVSFLEGNPDRPIIIGRVYNAANMPPFELPKEMTRSGIKSNTHKGAGYNEMTMDDTAGNEQIRIHGQHNMDSVINNNETHKVGVNRTRQVGNNEAVQVGVNQLLKVGTDQAITVGNNQSTTVGVNQSTNVGVNQIINAGSNISITAGTSITLRCGASMIHMNQAGFITISGTVITIAAAANLAATAPLTEIVGGVMLSAVGGITLVEGGVTHVGSAKLTSVTSGGQVDVVANGGLIAKGAPITLNG